jgi:hypothetical protein
MAAIQVRPSAQAPGSRPSSAPTSDRSASCRPRPCGSQPLAPTHGGTWKNKAAHASGSEPGRRYGRGGSGPLRAASTADSLSIPVASPYCQATISSSDAPQRSAAASTLPALVPTTSSASAAGTRSRSRTSTPVIQAAPSTPPAPSTSPTLGWERRVTRSGPKTTAGTSASVIHPRMKLPNGNSGAGVLPL